MYDDFYNIYILDAEFHGRYAADLHPVGSDTMTLLRYESNAGRIETEQKGLYLSPLAKLSVPMKRAATRKDESSLKKSKKSVEDPKSDSDSDYNDKNN